MKIFTQRFEELSEQLKQVESAETSKHRPIGHGTYQHIDDHLILNWAVKTRTLISSACGKDSEHYMSFVEAEKIRSQVDSPTRVKRMGAVFLAAREDFDGGYINSIRNLIHAELADNEIDQAKELFAFRLQRGRCCSGGRCS